MMENQQGGIAVAQNEVSRLVDGLSEMQPITHDDGIDPMDANIQNISVSFKKSIGLELANQIASLNRGAELSESERYYTFSAPFLRFTRSDMEQIFGKMSDTKWRMLFVLREGETRTFSNQVFEIGVPLPSVEDNGNGSREWVQLNSRVEKEVKEDMDRARELLGLSQTEFIAQAIIELIGQVKESM